MAERIDPALCSHCSDVDIPGYPCCYCGWSSPDDPPHPTFDPPRLLPGQAPFRLTEGS